MPERVASQGQPKEYAQTYHEPFRGKPHKVDDLTLIGPDASKCVRMEPEGLRITLPPGKKRQPTGVATTFGMRGDFEVSVGYEILDEPEPADAGDGSGTRISLTINLNRAGANEAFIRRKVTTTQRPHILTWRRLSKDADSPPEDLGTSFPVTAKTGRFRLVRTGADLAFYLSEAADNNFTLLQTFPLGTDDVKDIQIFAATGSDKASLEARFTDLRISAASLPRQADLPKVDNEPKIPTKDYAQTYHQSFKGSGARPEAWKFTSRLSEQRVHFEQAGLRITLPPGGPPNGQSAGIVTGFGVKGDFEITLSFEILRDPDPATVGKTGTRLSLAVTLDTPLVDTPKAEVATLSRTMASKGFVTWMRNRDRPVPLSYSFATPAMTGRFRLVRSSDELFYLGSIGPDQPFKFLKKYRFGADDLKRAGIVVSTGSDKAMVDVRVSDFSIRADAVPGAPGLQTVADSQPPVTTAPPERVKGRSLLVLLLALALGAILALGLFWRRRGGGAAKKPPNVRTTV
jgi:hypothetical protein